MKNKLNTEIKDYGFTEVKRVYNKNLSKGLIYAVIVHAVVIGIYLISSYFNKTDAVEIQHIDPLIIVDIEDMNKVIERENEVVKVEPQEITEVVKTIKDMAALEPVPVKQNDADNSVTKTQTELENTGNNVGREGDSTGLYADNSGKNNTIEDSEIKPEIEKVIEDPNKNYNPYEVEVAPECVNLSQVKGMMRYPEIAREINEEGKVNVKVLVGQDGSVIQVGKLTGKEIFFDEVKDKATELKFKPGIMNNRAVRVWVTIPFNFKLQ